MRLKILFAVLFVMTTAWLSSASDIAAIGQDADRVQDYLKLLEMARNQYSEDLGYSSDILDEYVKNNITSREAMAATTSIFVLSSQTLDTIDRIEPPSAFIVYHSYVLYSLKYLNIYLWYMAKFYETNNSDYALHARNYFNLSISNYENGLYELERLL